MVMGLGIDMGMMRVMTQPIDSDGDGVGGGCDACVTCSSCGAICRDVTTICKCDGASCGMMCGVCTARLW